MTASKVVIRIQNEAMPFRALAEARQLSRACRRFNASRVKVDGTVDTSQDVLIGMLPDLKGAKVSIYTGPPKQRPTHTLELRAKSCAEELNAALYDLARSCERDDLKFEAQALEHEAKALYNRIMRLQSHRKWLGDRGLTK